MEATLTFVLVDAFIVFLIILGVALFCTPPGARRGTLLAALAMACAIVAALLRLDIHGGALVAASLAVGAVAGTVVALRVDMIQVPALVAFQHGAGGMAAFLVCALELWRGVAAGLGSLPTVAGLAGLLVGAATFSASLIAGSKLANLLGSRPLVLRGHSALVLGSALAAVALAVGAGVLLPMGGWGLAALLAATVLVAAALGVAAALRVGGADMPVLISTLNATAGFAAAFSGIILGSYLLVAAGATVAASGSVLTQVMCRAMNRHLLRVFVGPGPGAAGGAPALGGDGDSGHPAESRPLPGTREVADPFAAAALSLEQARSVIIVPGYGMALAQAQFDLASLARKLETKGTDVRYAIHPVAGRMPGHMNVLLAEADVSYDLLVEMGDINPRFGDTDVVVVVGACDVVNPAAIERQGTPISGMPILRAMDARTVVVCNYDENPGYSGVENPLYKEDKSILLWGDARASLERLNGLLGA